MYFNKKFLFTITFKIKMAEYRFKSFEASNNLSNIIIGINLYWVVYIEKYYSGILFENMNIC